MEVWQDNHKFQVLLDVSQYSPNEINIKAVNHEIIIHASHEERSDQHGYITRSFRRRVELPEGIQSNQIISYLTPEGFLTIIAPKGPEDSNYERTIPIYPTRHVKWPGHHGHGLVQQRVQHVPLQLERDQEQRTTPAA